VENHGTEELPSSHDLPDCINTTGASTNTAAVPIRQEKATPRGRRRFPRTLFSLKPGELGAPLASERGKALAQTICSGCRHHPGRLQDLRSVFPAPRPQRDEEGALPLPTAAQRLFLTRTTGPRKSLLSLVHLIPEKLIAAPLKAGHRAYF